LFFTLTKGIKDIDNARGIRKRVFVEELGVPIEIEQDALDETAYHLVLFDREQAVAVGRIIILDNNTAVFGRIAVEKKFRGEGYGEVLLIKMLDRAKNEFGMERIELHAQATVIGFYEKYGFTSKGPRFTEAGIEHQAMVLEADELKHCGL